MNSSLLSDSIIRSNKNLLLSKIFSLLALIPLVVAVVPSSSLAESYDQEPVARLGSNNLRSSARTLLSLTDIESSSFSSRPEAEETWHDYSSNIPSQPSQQVEEYKDEEQASYLRRNLVFGGNASQVGVYTWFVELIAGNPNGNYAQPCVGTMISGNTVVTLASCVFDTRGILADPHGSKAWIKRYTIKKGQGIFRHWADIRVHPDYVVGERANNVAVIKLAGIELFPERDVQNINSDPEVPASNQEVYIMGYGSPFNNVTELQNTTVRISPENNPQCLTLLADQLICADTTGTGKDLCPGDEGAAMWTRDNTLHGMYFEGGTCNGGGLSDAVFVRVSQFQGFITGAACEMANARCIESCGFASAAQGVAATALNLVTTARNSVVGLWNSFRGSDSSGDEDGED